MVQTSSILECKNARIQEIMAQQEYTEDNIQSLDWKEHIRLRPGMYIGKLGDGSQPDDGIYVLLKEVIDNSIDEYVMGHGSVIEIEIKEGEVRVRDFGRGIPLGKVVDCVSKMNTGGKYDNRAFQKSVGLNGVGTKAVNALSDHFTVTAYRDGKMKRATFNEGHLDHESKITKSGQSANGTEIVFTPDGKVFKNYRFRPDLVERRLWNYAYLNAGLKLKFNGKRIVSKNGLLDLLENRTQNEVIRYPIIHLSDDDIELALTHGNHYGEQYHSFVNGQYTTQGGTHLTAFREGIVKAVRDFYGKNYDAKDIRASIIAAISVRVEDPVFESQTKTKLGSVHMGPDRATITTFVGNFIKKHLNDFLHKKPEVAEKLKARIQQSERERKEIAGIKKLANERAKKASVHNKKLRDCRIHLTTKRAKLEDQYASTIFITEGDSASGSITKARDVQSQAVFSLRGKPLNCFGLTKKIVYQNEELNLLQHALNIEDGLEGLRYNRVVIATDADVDGMHIRLLLLTFFLQFFPDLVREEHLYILDTPLFRVRDKRQTFYCYNEAERLAAIDALKGKAEITRFKGLGEISPDEFGDFIGKNIRLEKVLLLEDTNIEDVLAYYMGKNTMQRQEFIIENLKVEIDQVDELSTKVAEEAEAMV
ncbi:MAG: type IIA DNA topoisomerase subunit B [Saprospiraceae bacterium]|nr:type IIA DNA topoisomerase subunit B [Saprospiraceae bacterium]